jgi:hypothetical protein
MLISFDIGIKNLAFCIFDTSSEKYKIHDWGVINLCGEKVKCCSKTKRGTCSKNASYIYNNNYYCGTHVKNCGSKLAPECYYKIIKSKRPAKKYIKMLKTFLVSDRIDVDNLCIECINNHPTKITKGPNASKIDLIDIGIAISKILPERLPLTSIKRVVIENQISPIANRMKTVQGMLAQFFIDRNVTDIMFISSSNKLKGFDVPKKNYKERKASGIKVTRDIIQENINCQNWLEKFDKHTKKDDLADSFLQGLWVINHNKN